MVLLDLDKFFYCSVQVEEVSEDVVLVKVGLQRHLRFLAKS